jgi:hypothetical protein
MIAVYFYTISINLFVEDRTIEYTVPDSINGVLYSTKDLKRASKPETGIQ